MTRNKILLALAVAALPVIGGGCALLLVGGAAAAAGVGTYAYVNGELKGTEAVPLDRAYSASQKGLEEMQFPITAKTKDALEGQLTARTATDKKITVKVKKVSDTTTEIRIRVGTWGDEAVSRMIQEKIRKHF